MILGNCVLAGLSLLAGIYCLLLLLRNRGLVKAVKALADSAIPIEENSKTIKSLKKFKKAVKIKEGDITIYKLIVLQGKVFDIEKINNISNSNISKFLEDNPEVAKEHKQRIWRNFRNLAKDSPYPMSFRRGVISGRENILEILGEDIVDLFFIDFVDKFEEHFKLLTQAQKDLSCSFKQR